MSKEEGLLWIKALQETLCEFMNAAAFGSEDQEFMTEWTQAVSDWWIQKNAPNLVQHVS